MIDIRFAYRQLTELEARLSSRLGDRPVHERGGDEGDQAARAYDGHAGALDADRVRARLADVRDALDRIRVGGYGDCLQCGEPIGKKRIEAIPETPFCLSCAETLERQARVSSGRVIDMEEDEDV